VASIPLKQQAQAVDQNDFLKNKKIKKCSE
jgi:hypothetical protein